MADRLSVSLWRSIGFGHHFVLGTGYWVLLFGFAKSRLVVAKTMERFGLRLGWGGSTLLGLAVRQLTVGAGTTERRYRAFTGRPGPSGPWSSGRRENPERANVSADAPSGFLASRARFARRTQYSVFWFLAPRGEIRYRFRTG